MRRAGCAVSRLEPQSHRATSRGESKPVGTRLNLSWRMTLWEGLGAEKPVGGGKVGEAAVPSGRRSLTSLALPAGVARSSQQGEQQRGAGWRDLEVCLPSFLLCQNTHDTNLSS